MRHLHDTAWLLVLAVVTITSSLCLSAQESPRSVPGIILYKQAAPPSYDGKAHPPEPIGATKVVITPQNRVFYTDNSAIYELKQNSRPVHFTGRAKSEEYDGPPSRSGFFRINNLLALPDGRLLATDNGDVRLIDTAGNVRTIYSYIEDPNPPKNPNKNLPKSNEQLARELLAEAERRNSLKHKVMIEGLAMDKNGAIYVTSPSTDVSAIYTLDLTGKLELYAKIPPENLHDQAIFPGIAVDKNLNVYVAVLDGVCKISKLGKLVPFSTPIKDPPNGKFPRVITQMQFDPEGNLWVAGEEDDELIAIIAPDGSVHYPNKGIKDDLQKIKGSGFAFDRAGSLYITGYPGLRSFAPAMWKARLAPSAKK